MARKRRIYIMKSIKIGDKVKVISEVRYDNGFAVEHIPIGTICEVIDIKKEKDGSFLYGISENKTEKCPFYYKRIDEIEFGYEIWVPQRTDGATQIGYEINIKENTGSRREHCIRTDLLPISISIDSTLEILKQNKDKYNINGDASIFIKPVNLDDL